MTGEEWCKELSARLKKRGVDLTPDEIWNSSPTGELWPLFELQHKLDYLDERDKNGQDLQEV